MKLTQLLKLAARAVQAIVALVLSNDYKAPLASPSLTMN